MTAGRSQLSVQPRVWSRAAPALLRWLERQSVDIMAVVRRLELSSDFLEDPDATLQMPQFLNLWSIAAEIEPAIGLLLIDEVSEDDLHLVNHILRRSRTIREAIKECVHYGRLVSEVYTTMLVEDGAEAFLVFHTPDLPWRSHHVTEYHLSGMLRLANQETDGSFTISGISLPHASPGYSDKYREIFGVEPKFNQPDAFISFPSSMLELQMKSYSPHINNILRAHADTLLVETDESARVTIRAKSAATRRLVNGRLPTAEQIANDLHLTERSLRQRLRDEGIPWRRLLEAVRRDVVEHRLREGWTVVEIASAVGYSEPAVLHHAIRRWFRMSAAEFQESSRS